MKQEKIAEWKAKGIEWLANQLWQQRNTHLAMNEKLSSIEANLRHAQSENEVLETIKEQNTNLASILEDNGIRPTKLRITYQEKDCKHCDFGFDLGGEEYECDSDFPDYERCPKKKIVETAYFYTYTIDDGLVSGIVKNFSSRAMYDVLKVVDERSGDTIWEREAE